MGVDVGWETFLRHVKKLGESFLSIVQREPFHKGPAWEDSDKDWGFKFKPIWIRINTTQTISRVGDKENTLAWETFMQIQNLCEGLIGMEKR